MKHTPGPWRINEAIGCQYGHFGCMSGYWRIENSSGCGIAYVAHQIKRQEANARLVAAAPDLLEALEEILDINGGSVDDTAQEIHDIAAAAIRKATEEK